MQGITHHTPQIYQNRPIVSNSPKVSFVTLNWEDYCKSNESLDSYMQISQTAMLNDKVTFENIENYLFWADRGCKESNSALENLYKHTLHIATLTCNWQIQKNIFYFVKQAADKNSPTACFYCAKFFTKGWPEIKDPTLALLNLQEAANLGHREAPLTLFHYFNAEFNETGDVLARQTAFQYEKLFESNYNKINPINPNQ